MAYATVDGFLARFPHLESQNISEVEAALDSASEWIDGYCARRFDLDDPATSRDLAATDPFCMDLGRYEIGDVTGVTVKLDDGTGTFAQTLTAADFTLLPVNATADGKPFRTIRALTFTWPIAYTPGTRQELVRVTARFGWPAVPAAVRNACMALANDEFENPGGVRSEAIDGYSVTYGQNAVRSAETRLALFRRMWAA